MTNEHLALIHAERRVTYRAIATVAEAWTSGNNAGEGYPIGAETDHISEIEEAGELIDTVDNGQIAVYWAADRLVLVADVGGPWAIDVESGPKGE